MEGGEDAAEARANGRVEEGLEGREAGADDADAEFDLGPELVAGVGPGYVGVVDVGDGPAAEDGCGAGAGGWVGLVNLWGFFAFVWVGEVRGVGMGMGMIVVVGG